MDAENVNVGGITDGVSDGVSDGVGVGVGNGVGGGVSADHSVGVVTAVGVDMNSVVIKDGIDGNARNLSLSIEERVAHLETEINDLSNAMDIFRDRLVKLIENSNEAVLGEGGGRRDVVTSAQFEQFCDTAISNGHHIGVSRCFIKTYLEREFGIEASRYTDRRLGAFLRRRVQEGGYKLENSLYSLKKMN